MQSEKSDLMSERPDYGSKKPVLVCERSDMEYEKPIQYLRGLI